MDKAEAEAKVKGWATSGIVLGALVLIVSLFTVYTYLKPGNPVYGILWANIALGSLNAITALCFITGGALTHQGNKVGRDILWIAALAAILLVVVGAAYQFYVFLDPATLQTMVNAAVAKAGANADPESFDKAMKITLEASMGFGILVGIIQVVYNIMMYKVMSAEDEEEAEAA